MQKDAKFPAAIGGRLGLKVIASALALVFVGVFSLMMTSTAQAESQICKRLERQLASLGSGGGGRSKSVTRAIRGQQKQIGIAKRRLNRLRCSKRRLFFFRDAHPSCGQLRGALQRMRNNLAALQARGGGRSGNSRRQRKKIQRAMRRNACGVTRSAKRSPGKSINDQIFGRKTKKSKKSRRTANAKNRSEQVSKKLVSRNTSRMVCVRTCDGYFFPVSLTKRRSLSNGDAAACENLCPGTDMKLYYRKSADDDPKNLVSVANREPYSALPTAFAYQKAFNPNCSCNFRQSVKQNKTIAGKEKRETVRRRTSIAKRAVQKTAMPIWRPDSAADPETAANRRGDLDLASLGAPNEERPFSEVSQRNVRIVGESFLPGQ